MHAPYAGRRVLVTGGTGFIGSHLVEALQGQGAIVRRLDRAAVDLRDGEAVVRAVELAAPEIVFHLAAAGVGDLFADQTGQFGTNATGTMNVLEGARWAGVARVVAFGTCFEYGPSSQLLDEHAPLSARNPYAVSKAAAFAAVRHAVEVMGEDIVWLRPFAVYGPGQPAAKLVPSLIASCGAAKPAPFGSGRQAWDYVHVHDVVEAALVAGLHPDAKGGVFNIGTSETFTARAIAMELAELTGCTPNIAWGVRRERPGDPAVMCADIALIQDKLGWRPTIDLRTGLSGLVTAWREAA